MSPLLSSSKGTNGRYRRRGGGKEALPRFGRANQDPQRHSLGCLSRRVERVSTNNYSTTPTTRHHGGENSHLSCKDGADNSEEVGPLLIGLHSIDNHRDQCEGGTNVEHDKSGDDFIGCGDRGAETDQIHDKDDCQKGCSDDKEGGDRDHEGPVTATLASTGFE
uniref:Uncharacterized protein n=1 Tax=Schistocephalus solidus TaxID=70667 RepID=A0A0X3P3G8_SCHSO